MEPASGSFLQWIVTKNICRLDPVDYASLGLGPSRQDSPEPLHALHSPLSEVPPPAHATMGRAAPSSLPEFSASAKGPDNAPPGLDRRVLKGGRHWPDIDSCNPYLFRPDLGDREKTMYCEPAPNDVYYSDRSPASMFQDGLAACQGAAESDHCDGTIEGLPTGYCRRSTMPGNPLWCVATQFGGEPAGRKLAVGGRNRSSDAVQIVDTIVFTPVDRNGTAANAPRILTLVARGSPPSAAAEQLQPTATTPELAARAAQNEPPAAWTVPANARDRRVDQDWVANVEFKQFKNMRRSCAHRFAGDLCNYFGRINVGICVVRYLFLPLSAAFPVSPALAVRQSPTTGRAIAYDSCRYLQLFLHVRRMLPRSKARAMAFFAMYRI